MLESTFIHLPGIGRETEQSLWDQGCLTWADLDQGLDSFSVGSADRSEVKRGLVNSADSLAGRKGEYFKNGLGLKESWRAYPDFKDSCVYVDIETDGGQSGQSITTIGAFDGVEFQCFVKGKNLTDFPDYMKQFGMIVTFYGANFDLPMIEKRFHSLKFKQIHLDLCPTLRQIGVTGGLKKIEKQLGISRGDDVDGLGGLDAIRLWNRYANLGDEQALETLIAYNREDVVNLEYLAGYAYKHLKERTFKPAALS